MDNTKRLHELSCTRNADKLSDSRIEELLAQLDNWDLVDNNGIKKLSKTFKFDNYARAFMFASAVSFIAEHQDHHPDLELGWGYCRVTIYTHKQKGLTLNDFILAAKIDRLLK